MIPGITERVQQNFTHIVMHVSRLVVATFNTCYEVQVFYRYKKLKQLTKIFLVQDVLVSEIGISNHWFSISKRSFCNTLTQNVSDILNIRFYSSFLSYGTSLCHYRISLDTAYTQSLSTMHLVLLYWMYGIRKHDLQSSCLGNFNR